VSLGNLSKLENGWKWYNEGKKFFLKEKLNLRKTYYMQR
jgi:hypothetical protein